MRLGFECVGWVVSLLLLVCRSWFGLINWLLVVCFVELFRHVFIVDCVFVGWWLELSVLLGLLGVVVCLFC